MTKEEALEKSGVNFNALKFELEYTAKNILLAMQIWSDQESDKAVAKRDEEIAKWLDDRHHYYEHPDFYIHLNVAEYKQFLSTPSASTEPSIPIREIEKLKDRYERMLMLLQMRNIKNSKLGGYQIFISELDNILQSIKPKP